MNIEVKNIKGESVEEIEIRDDVFGVPMNSVLVHQVVVGQLANARQGTAKAKTRSEVSGGGRKPRPQKGTGSSRQGSIRSPLWKGGGVTFGPSPRSYRQRTPKKMRRAAIRMTLSDKVREGTLIVLQDLTLDSPKTKDFVAMMQALDVERSVPSRRRRRRLWLTPRRPKCAGRGHAARRPAEHRRRDEPPDSHLDG